MKRRTKSILLNLAKEVGVQEDDVQEILKIYEYSFDIISPLWRFIEDDDLMTEADIINHIVKILKSNESTAQENHKLELERIRGPKYQIKLEIDEVEREIRKMEKALEKVSFLEQEEGQKKIDIQKEKVRALKEELELESNNPDEKHQEELMVKAVKYIDKLEERAGYIIKYERAHSLVKEKNNERREGLRKYYELKYKIDLKKKDLSFEHEERNKEDLTKEIAQLTTEIKTHLKSFLSWEVTKRSQFDLFHPKYSGVAGEEIRLILKTIDDLKDIPEELYNGNRIDSLTREQQEYFQTHKKRINEILEKEKTEGLEKLSREDQALFRNYKKDLREDYELEVDRIILKRQNFLDLTQQEQQELDFYEENFAEDFLSDFSKRKEKSSYLEIYKAIYFDSHLNRNRDKRFYGEEGVEVLNRILEPYYEARNKFMDSLEEARKSEGEIQSRLEKFEERNPPPASFPNHLIRRVRESSANRFLQGLKKYRQVSSHGKVNLGGNFDFSVKKDSGADRLTQEMEKDRLKFSDREEFTGTKERIRDHMAKENFIDSSSLDEIMGKIIKESVEKSRLKEGLTYSDSVNPINALTFIFIAVKNQGLGNKREELRNDLIEIYPEAFEGSIRRLEDQAIKFSANFQKACNKFGLMTGNENADRFVGMRTKRVDLMSLLSPDLLKELGLKTREAKEHFSFLEDSLGVTIDEISHPKTSVHAPEWVGKLAQEDVLARG